MLVPSSLGKKERGQDSSLLANNLIPNICESARDDSEVREDEQDALLEEFPWLRKEKFDPRLLDNLMTDCQWQAWLPVITS